ncbi:MAG: AraC family transcriptional regulator [Myxococcales bacterium]|nr:AraC family transcriptional regulator [Myxococcales bacterium]
MEALGDILAALRIRSSLISHARFTAPWSVSTSGAPEPGSAIFHAVVRGSCWVCLGSNSRGGERVELGPGDVALVSRGEAHVTCSALRLVPQPVASLSHEQRPSGVPHVEHGGGGERVDIVCGSFAFDHASADILLEILPRLAHIPGSRDRSRWLSATLEMLASELDGAMPGREAVVSRLAEVLVLHLLRAYLLALPADRTGWVAGLRDPQIGRALAQIHAEPGREIDAEGLARSVGMSRAAFFARFGELVGQTPARYLARWRMRAAADILARTDLPLATVAQRVGYKNEQAFARAFRRVMGESPRSYREP